MTTQDLVLANLQGVRRHVLRAVDGLDDEALRRPVLPSGWTCLGLVHHLALDVEQFWFRGVVAGDPDVIAWHEADHGDPWVVPAETSAQEVLDLYRRETARADELLAAADWDAPPAWWPSDWFGGQTLDCVAEAVVHVLRETAVHAGHLDAVRELIDGHQNLVLT